MSLLDKKLTPEGDIFKFTNPGERIHAEFLGRRTVKTKKQDRAAVFDCDIIESRKIDRNEEESGPVGIHTVFASTHITDLLDRAALEKGDYFVLQLCSIDPKKGFKKFALERVGPTG